ncbi:MAG: hypothetical protein HOQ38_07875 [Nonomuraea sp.]|nr:hypothetical protein [Nonomuraea sp.]
MTASQVVGALVADPDQVTVQRDAERLLVGDARVLWDLAALPAQATVPATSHEPTGRLPHLDTMVDDGTWAWHPQRRPRLLRPTPRYDLAAAWRQLHGDYLHEADSYARIDWSPWSYQQARIGLLHHTPLAVNDAWLRRVHHTYPNLAMSGIDPRMPLVILTGAEARVVGFADAAILPDSSRDVLTAISSAQPIHV